jgi:hypothetical protein
MLRKWGVGEGGRKQEHSNYSSMPRARVILRLPEIFDEIMYNEQRSKQKSDKAPPKFPVASPIETT